MQKLFVVALLLLSMDAFASTVEVTNCQSQSRSHRLQLKNISEGVEIRFEELFHQVFPSTGRALSYKVTGKSITERTIHGISLQEISRKSSLLIEPIVSILRSRPEFDGEADMSYAYANDYVKGLVCK